MRRTYTSFLLCLVVAGGTLRWLYRGHYLEGWDAVDFALALHEFDLAKHQPHLPGYPVYIALAKSFQWAIRPTVMQDTTALILPGIVFSTLAVIPIALLASHWTKRCITPPPPPNENDRSCYATKSSLSPYLNDATSGIVLWAGVTAVSLYLLSPGLWLQAEKPLSDALGCSLLPWVALTLTYALYPSAKRSSSLWWVGTTGALMGLVLGTRLSYWPFVLGCALIILIQRPTRFKELALWGCGGLGIGTCVWILPLILHTGSAELIQSSIHFSTGHFTRWGGTVFSDEIGLGRYMTWWWGIWAFSLGGYWPEAPQNIWRVPFSISFCLLLLWAMLHKPIRPAMLSVGALIAPYLVWILIGQNPERPRHALPPILFLYPLAGVTIGVLMFQWGNTKLKLVAPAIGTLAVIFSSLITFPLVKAYAETMPPQSAFVEHVKTHFDPEETSVFTWETQRLFAYHAPEFDVARARGLNEVAAVVRAAEFQGTVLFSSKLGQKLSKYYCFDYLTTFRRSRYVEPWFSTLSLFSYCGTREDSRKSTPISQQ
ncbi:MAG: hypothetical protein CMH81_02170 [Nitrospiraceae bacterium]|nr:hypothetical protein [Nitrospiraceae bacterium]